jgi:DtxR family Mn-dependent transcriptional regulator
MPDSSQLCIADLEPGNTGVVARVGEQQADRLRYLAELGLVPGARVAVAARAPFDGPLTIDVDGAPRALDQRLARTIFVEREHA